MKRELNIWKIKWIDSVNLKQEEIKEILKPYNFHELDIEACLEWNQKARIDEYEDYSFIIFHFPKYNSAKKIYELNEFNIFLWKNFLITFRDFNSSHINKIFTEYNNIKELDKKEKKKITSAYLLYEIIQIMLEKMFKASKINNKEIKILEDAVFEKDDESLAKEIMIKKRNIMLVKNIFKPQVLFFKNLEKVINEIYNSEMEVYFEDLEDKLDQILSEFTILQEYVDSLEDAFKTMLDIKTNSVMKLLTFFSAFMLPLTFITSFYGMNIVLPYEKDPNVVYFILFLSTIFMFLLYIYMKKKEKI